MWYFPSSYGLQLVQSLGLYVTSVRFTIIVHAPKLTESTVGSHLTAALKRLSVAEVFVLACMPDHFLQIVCRAAYSHERSSGQLNVFSFEFDRPFFA